ncbi:MAG: hypothetical protein ACRC8S_04020 [Fimbriiglobus sp.]
MSTRTAIQEFQLAWLPKVTDQGLNRLIYLLETASPFLIHGTFCKSGPQGCLATQIAWNHPKTAHLNDEAGICWLTRIARMNPATSHLIVAWDEAGLTNHDLRFGLLDACYSERKQREETFIEETFELVGSY